MKMDSGSAGARRHWRSVSSLALCLTFGCGSRSITSDQDGSLADAWDPREPGEQVGLDGDAGASSGPIGAATGNGTNVPGGMNEPGTMTPGGVVNGTPTGSGTGTVPGTEPGTPATMTGTVAVPPVTGTMTGATTGTVPGVIFGGSTSVPVRPPMMGFAGGSNVGGATNVGGAANVAGAPVSTDDCKSNYNYDDGGWCESQLECSNGYLYTNCSSDGASWWCSCSDSYASQSIQFTGLESGACDYAANFCLDGGVDPDLPTTCAPTYQDQYTDSCTQQIDCVQSVESSGVEAQAHRSRYVSCYADGSDWQCDCSWDYFSARVRLTGDQGSDTACPTALELCEVAPDAGSPIECSRVYQSSSVGSCDAQLECLQAAAVEGGNVQIVTSAYTYCWPLDDATWQCECSGSTSGTATTLEVAGDDSWNVCGAASEACAAFVSGE